MVEKLTIGIVGNQYSNGGNQPLINVDSPFNLYSEYPFDTNVMSGSYIEVKHTGEYISYVFNLRPSLIHSVGATRDGVFWIALTIPVGMNVYDADDNCVSPINILEKVFSIFSEHYMQKRGNGYEFKEGTCYRKPVDDYIDSLKLVRNSFISPVYMDSNGDVCYLDMDREKMGLFLKDTHYPELSKYKSVIIAESINSRSIFNSPIPRPLYIDVRYGEESLGRIDYYSREPFHCIVEPVNKDTHGSVAVNFSMNDFRNSSELKRNEFTAKIGQKCIIVDPIFPPKSCFIQILQDDSVWKGSYIENDKRVRIMATQAESGTSYGFILSGTQLAEKWELHTAGYLSNVIWKVDIIGGCAVPKFPRIGENITKAEKQTAGLTSEGIISDSDTDVILGVDDIKTLCKEDHDAKLLLFFDKGSGYSKNSILVETKRVFEFLASQSWRLKAPYNPHLSGYRLEIKSNKYNYKTQKSNEELPLHNIVEATPKEPFYITTLDFFNNHFKAILSVLFLIVFIGVGVFCFYNRDTISKLIQNFTIQTTEDGGAVSSDTEASSEIELPPVAPEITIDYVRQCVKNLKYKDHDLRIDDLEDLLLQLTVEEMNLQECKLLLNICTEIKRLQNGTYKYYQLNEYQKKNDNELRKNIQSLRKIFPDIYYGLEEALGPLYLINGRSVPNEKYDEFQQAYIIENYKKLKEITTFSELHALYEKFKQADE